MKAAAGSTENVILVVQHAPALAGSGRADRSVEGKLHDRIAGGGVIEGQPGLRGRNDSIEVVAEGADLNLPILVLVRGTCILQPLGKRGSVCEARVDRGVRLTGGEKETTLNERVDIGLFAGKEQPAVGGSLQLCGVASQRFGRVGSLGVNAHTAK